jgi:hypothetical protein
MHSRSNDLPGVQKTTLRFWEKVLENILLPLRTGWDRGGMAITNPRHSRKQEIEK